MREIPHARRSRNRCEGESYDSLLTAGAGFRRGRSLRDQAPREVKPKARMEDVGPDGRCVPSGLTLSAAGRAATAAAESPLQRRPGWESLRPGRSVPTREAARRRGGLDGDIALRNRT